METLVENDKCKFSVDWQHGVVALLHLEVYKWSHTLFKNYYLPEWGKMLQRLKDEGAHSVCALVPSDDEKVSKFHALLGMYEAWDDGVWRINRRWL